jgi:hypothetical protein
MITTFSPRVSKLSIIPVDRESLLNAIIRFEKSNDQILNGCILSLKDTCTRRLLLLLGDDHEIYKIYLSPQLIRYVTYDYLTETNNIQYRLKNDDKFLSNLKLLFCRDCSLNDLGASKCRRRKCLANRVRQVFSQLSCQIIPWEKRQSFAILENNDDDDEDNPIVFIYLKSNNSGCKKHNDQNWIEEQFYLLDLLRILHINMFRE